MKDHKSFNYCVTLLRLKSIFLVNIFQEEKLPFRRKKFVLQFLSVLATSFTITSHKKKNIKSYNIYI